MEDAFVYLKDYFTTEQLKHIKEDYLILIKENDETIKEWEDFCKNKDNLRKTAKAELNLAASIADDARAETKDLKELIELIDKEIAERQRQIEEMIEANKSGKKYIF